MDMYYIWLNYTVHVALPDENAVQLCTYMYHASQHITSFWFYYLPLNCSASVVEELLFRYPHACNNCCSDGVKRENRKRR